MDNKQLEVLNTEIRQDIIKMLGKSKSGHPGGSLSCVEIISTLYNRIMNVDPNNTEMENRDRFVLSKGHAAPTLYSVLAHKGYFPVDELMTLRKLGSILQGHPDKKKVPGVEASTGSLGQGVSIAGGMALGSKLSKKDFNVYALVGDGEMQEGQFWESAMSAAHYKLDNFTIIIDHNGLQIDGNNDEVLSLGDIKGKMESFGFKVIEVAGHNVDELTQAFKAETKEQPKCIIAHTVKGKGVSFMEDQVGWHGKAPSEEEVNTALNELGGK